MIRMQGSLRRRCSVVQESLISRWSVVALKDKLILPSLFHKDGNTLKYGLNSMHDQNQRNIFFLLKGVCKK